MKLFESLVDYLEDELVRAGIRGVQFCINGESHHKRKLDLADDVIRWSLPSFCCKCYD